MRIIFMGTPEFAVPSLQALVEAGHEVVAAYTQPPRPGGRRGKELTLTPVHRAAQEMGIEVRHPASLKDLVAEADFAALEADVAVVAAYGLILPQAVLDMPKARLPQRPRLAPAALARSRPDPTCDPGR